MKGMTLTIRMRLYLMVSLALLFMIIVGVMGLRGMMQADEGLRTVYEDRLVPTGQISGIIERLMDDRIQLVTVLRDPTPANIQARARTIDENTVEINRTWNTFMETYLTPRERELAEAFTREREGFLNNGMKPAVQALENGNLEEAARILENEVEPRYRNTRAVAQDLLNLQLEVADEVYNDAVAHYIWTRNVTLALLIAAVLISLFTSYLVVRRITGVVTELEEASASMANGDLTVSLLEVGNDELTRVTRSFNHMARGFREIIGQVTVGCHTTGSCIRGAFRRHHPDHPGREAAAKPD